MYGLCLRKNNAKDNPLGHEVLKYMFVLALLPADKIWDGIDVVYEIIDKNFKNDKKTRNRWHKFLKKYCIKQWVKRVTPEIFSVFDEIDRTTNYVESNNRTSNLSLRSKPTCHNFVHEYTY